MKAPGRTKFYFLGIVGILLLIAVVWVTPWVPRSNQVLGAAMIGDLDKLKRSEASGENLDVQDPHIFGWTPLMAAIFSGQTNAVRYLLTRNLNLNAQDNRGDTALMLAITVGNTNTVKSLLERGADVTVLDKYGISAFEFARASSYSSILLDCLNKRASEELPALIESFRAGSISQRIHAMQAAGAIGVAASNAAPFLIEALKEKGSDGSVGVRSAAAKALGGIGPSASQAVPALIDALRDSEAGVRKDAAEALGKLKKTEATPALRSLLNDPDLNVRIATKASLQQITNY